MTPHVTINFFKITTGCSYSVPSALNKWYEFHTHVSNIGCVNSFGPISLLSASTLFQAIIDTGASLLASTQSQLYWLPRAPWDCACLWCCYCWQRYGQVACGSGWQDSTSVISCCLCPCCWTVTALFPADPLGVVSIHQGAFHPRWPCAVELLLQCSAIPLQPEQLSSHLTLYFQQAQPHNFKAQYACLLQEFNHNLKAG